MVDWQRGVKTRALASAAAFAMCAVLLMSPVREKFTRSTTGVSPFRTTTVGLVLEGTVQQQFTDGTAAKQNSTINNYLQMKTRFI